MARRIFSPRSIMMVGALAGTIGGIVAYRQRQARHMGIFARMRERLPIPGRRKATVLDTLASISQRSAKELQKTASNLAGKASETFSENIVPAAMERSQMARERAFEMGGRTREALGSAMSKGTSASVQALRTAEKVGEMRGSVGRTFGGGMRGIQTSASLKAESAFGSFRSTLGSLFRIMAIGSGLAAVLIYIYAPEREKQAELWEGAKESSRQIGRTFQDIRELVSDMFTEA